MAGRALKDSLSYIYGTFRQSTILSQINLAQLQSTFTGLGLNYVVNDPTFGVNSGNLSPWIDACNDNGFMKQRLIYYFNLNQTTQQTLFSTICSAFSASQTAIDNTICGRACSESSYFYQQFASSKISQTYY